MARDTVLAVKTDELPGITESPEYRKDYPAKATKDAKEKKPESRPVSFTNLIWSADGKNNVLVLRAHDTPAR